MHEIRLENYRCFRDRQAARLAPLTLLMGENSSGKTSFLAITRILSEFIFNFRRPNFKEAPYNLGGFDEIAYYRGAKGGRVTTFKAGLSAMSQLNGGKVTDIDVTFGKIGAIPIPIEWRISSGTTWLEKSHSVGGPYVIRGGTHRGAWEMPLDDSDLSVFDPEWDPIKRSYKFLWQNLIFDDKYAEAAFDPLGSSPPIRSEDLSTLCYLEDRNFLEFRQQRPFASAPVRSKPRRAYDPAPQTPDLDGNSAPTYLADRFSEDSQTWATLKEALEGFGRDAGLFDNISIRRLDNSQLQVQVTQFEGGLRGPTRSMFDVGYGVSHILPAITEMLRPDPPHLFLVQQPEVSLHPMAQAALGSLFCQVAGPERQIIVETHSVHLLDRIRMEVRDGVGWLTPDDVSILYFKRDALDVHVHSLRIDEDGNIVGTPDIYRQFFM